METCTVSNIRVENYHNTVVRAGLEALLAPLGGMSRFVLPGERVLIKPNMLSAKHPDKAVTTHPTVVKEVILLVREAGGIPFVGDSPGVGGVHRVAEKSGILDVLRETGTELVEFSESREMNGSGMFKRIPLATPYLDADRVINLPKLKTHEMMTITCGVKNLFGAVVGTAKAAWHLKAGADRELFARLLVEIYEVRHPDLTIVDAITAMEGDGPGSGDPRFVGCLLAGANALAVDKVAADIIGIPDKMRYVERAAERLGLPGVAAGSIRVLGDQPAELRVPDFRLPHISDVQFGLPGFLKHRLKSQLTSRPVAIAGKCVLCGICRDACPPGAITISNGQLSIDYRSCIRCFCCRELCPHAALAVREGLLLKLAKRVL
ncbi:DUF362 domain-containing protein [Geobacter pelophilus]|uniref:DUF362 domain-containing protein n=1 Tax=Geoanaerobacter pelophilus TaxID=60036 RepID=A0AAW4L371_9BACT|nr:DUF362 domain-containing protein [Geoanaerobacter pelophilus]MBT0665388.1 DUF362 domain-containing protein [Geoanaerobacter pelophilus]